MIVIFKNRKLKLESIIIFIVMIISPILSFPLVMYQGLTKNKSFIFNFSLLFAWLAFFIIPLYDDDLVRHWESYQIIKETGLKGYFFKVGYSMDILLYILMYLMSLLNLSKQFITFIIVLVSFFCIIKSYYLISSDSYYKVTLIILMGYLNFRILIIGLRYYSSMAFLIYGLTLIYYTNSKLRGAAWILMSILMHFSSIIIIPILLFIRFFKNKKYYLFLLMLAILFGICSRNIEIFEQIINNLPISLQIKNHILTYITGSWGINYNANFNIKGQIYIFLNSFLTVYFAEIYIFLNYKDKSNEVFYKIGILYLVIANFFKFSPTIFSRYGLVGFWFILFLIISQQNKKVYIYVLLIFSLMYLTIEINFYRKPYFYSYKEIYKYNFLNFYFYDIKKENLIMY